MHKNRFNLALNEVFQTGRVTETTTRKQPLIILVEDFCLFEKVSVFAMNMSTLGQNLCKFIFNLFSMYFSTRFLFIIEV